MGRSNPPSSVVEPTPNQRDPSPEVGPSNGSSAPPEPRKIPFAEFGHKRVPGKRRHQSVPGKRRIKVSEAFVREQVISKKGNPYDQVVVVYSLLGSTEELVKTAAAFTEEGERILEDIQPGGIYDVTEKELDDGFLHWTAIKPVPAK
jgi:hypothetical protein